MSLGCQMMPPPVPPQGWHSAFSLPFAEVSELEEAAPFILNTTVSELPLQEDR